MADLGDQPEPTRDEGPMRAPGGQDAAPTARDLSTPREASPLGNDQPRAAQTEDTAVSQQVEEPEEPDADDGPDSGDPRSPSEAPG